MPRTQSLTFTCQIQSITDKTGIIENAKNTAEIATNIATFIASLRAKLAKITHIDGEAIESITLACLSGLDTIETIELTFIANNKEKKKKFTIAELDTL